MLENKNMDARRGVDWLRANQDKFKHPDQVYEPIMTVIRLKDEYRQYSVQVRDCILKQVKAYYFHFLICAIGIYPKLFSFISWKQ